MKRTIIPLIIILLSTLLSGCDYHDINRRLFVVELGIDSIQESKIIGVSFKAAIPSGGTEGGGEKQQNSQAYYEEAPSIGEAVKKLKAETSLEPNFAHLKVIILGRDFAENYPVNPIINYFIRRTDVQNIADLIVGDPIARDIVSSTSKESSTPGSELFFKFGQGTKSPYAQETLTYEIYRSIHTPGETPYCPVVNMENGKLVINKVGVFDREFKMKYIMNPEETETFKILTNTSQSAFFDIQTPGNKPFGVSVTRIGSKAKFETGDDKKIICNINISGMAVLEETPETFQNIEELSNMFSSKITDDVTNLLHKLQSKSLDPTLFIKNYWASNSSFELTDDWPTKIFPNIKFNVSTKMKLESTGALQ